MRILWRIFTLAVNLSGDGGAPVSRVKGRGRFILPCSVVHEDEQHERDPHEAGEHPELNEVGAELHVHEVADDQVSLEDGDRHGNNVVRHRSPGEVDGRSEDGETHQAQECDQGLRIHRCREDVDGVIFTVGCHDLIAG